jgi:hypothetical protein
VGVYVEGVEGVADQTCCSLKESIRQGKAVKGITTDYVASSLFEWLVKRENGIARKQTSAFGVRAEKAQEETGGHGMR